MDPNATLRIIGEALSDGDTDTADEYCSCLAGWLEMGGFAPDWSEDRYAAAYYREVIR